jgi:hypothetical protein
MSVVPRCTNPFQYLSDTSADDVSIEISNQADDKQAGGLSARTLDNPFRVEGSVSGNGM